MEVSYTAAKWLLRQDGNFVRSKTRCVERVGTEYHCTGDGVCFVAGLVDAVAFLLEGRRYA